MSTSLDGLRILVVEDEFLIAMDVEQLCRDHGARDVVIAGSLNDLTDGRAPEGIDVAIVDLMLGGDSTVPFATSLRERGIPFVFASGYSDSSELSDAFPGVPMVGKPYSSEALVAAISQAARAPRDNLGGV